MASSTQSASAAEEGNTHINPSSTTPSTSIEMNNLESKSGAGAGLLNDVSIPTSSPMNPDFPTTTTTDKNTTPSGSSNEKTNTAPADPDTMASSSTSKDPLSSSSKGKEISTQSAPESTSSPHPPPVITRLDSVAIGPESTPTPVVPKDPELGPVLVITLLLTSGARHPYRIDERYLTKRQVNVPGKTESGKMDPYSISVYTLKELILREWREEWEAKPSSPSSIRLIYFGRLLDDSNALTGNSSRELIYFPFVWHHD